MTERGVADLEDRVVSRAGGRGVAGKLLQLDIEGGQTQPAPVPGIHA